MEKNTLTQKGERGDAIDAKVREREKERDATDASQIPDSSVGSGKQPRNSENQASCEDCAPRQANKLVSHQQHESPGRRKGRETRD